jgi:hypothetical protein
MSAKEMETTEVKTTAHYWGYRELEPHELQFVAGGDNSDGEAGGTQGDQAATEGGAGQSTSDGSSQAAISDKQYCMDYCSDKALPSGDFGWGYFNCLNRCLAGSGSSNSASAGCYDGGSGWDN